MKFKAIIVLGAIITSIGSLCSQDLVVPNYIKGSVPYEIPHNVKDSIEYEKGVIRRKFNVVEPTLEFFGLKKDKKLRPAMIFLPGGGYTCLAYMHEGKDFATWMEQKGMIGIVLNYRLPDDRMMTNKSEVPITDALNAIKYVREHSSELGIDPNKIGIMGFSAGGHLAASASVFYTDLTNKPNAVALIYPVITMQDEFTHKGSSKRLLGPNPDQAMKDRFSTEKHITKENAPTFLIHSADDKSVNYKNSLLYFDGLQSNQIPNCELHIFPKGGHGYGMALEKDGNLPQWTDWFYGWLKGLGW